MRSDPRAQIAVTLVAGLVPFAALAVWGVRPFSMAPIGHCLLVGIAATVAAGVAYALTTVGLRRRDARTVLVGSAFGVMGAILAVHGLVTPDVVFDSYWLAAASGGLTVPAGAAILLLTSVPALCQPERIRQLLLANIAVLSAIVVVTAAALVFPDLLPAAPRPGSPLAYVILAVGTACLAPVVIRAVRTYLLTRRTADLLVVVGLAWLGAALEASLTLTFAQLGWWLGHGIEVIGILLVASAVAADLRRSAGSRPLTGDLRAVELVRSAEAFLGARVHGLLGDLATKDRSTEEHTRRVAYLAVAVGETLGLGPATLRNLAEGGLLHDIGKLNVPDAILQKPGALDDEEYARIKRHPTDGDRILQGLGGFPSDVRALVLDHHERLDGKGYPNGKAAAEIGLPARILATCDVFDALVSPRVYREAWPTARALDLLHKETGTAFDGRCVAALEQVLADAAPVEAAA